jgi:hypothetical protein
MSLTEKQQRVLMADEINWSLGAQIEEIEREIKMRREVYPRRVAQGKMRQSLADAHISRMEAVLRTLNSLRETS